jgi:D-aminoacyl-tRNA deacylase
LLVLLSSDADIASMNIKARLLEEASWEPLAPCWGRPAFIRGGLVLLEKAGVHLSFDSVDSDIREYLHQQGVSSGKGLDGNGGEGPDIVVFLSKHRSEKEVDSLTVHPPGNYLEALYGGKEGTLAVAAPHHMTAALLALHREKRAAGLPDRTSFEVTHHGPLLATPCFFIEIGSGPHRWDRVDLARPIAKALLSERFMDPPKDIPIAIGIGGGHYAPRFSDRALKGDLAFGHMVPDHILERAPDPVRTLELAFGSTPGASVACFHRTKDNENALVPLISAAEAMGLNVMMG